MDERSPEPSEAQGDRCFRCGRPTPPGVSLCEADNPGRIGAPSATQMHATILLGVIGGFVLLAFLARYLSGGVGPFEASVIGRTAAEESGAALYVRVTNLGTREASASCRVTRGGVTAPDDPIFLTDPIPPGGSVELERLLRAGTMLAAAPLDRVTVRCT